MEFKTKLQELRKHKGLTQDELAVKLYVSRAAISKWESGRGYPSIDSLKAISDFFSVSLDELLSGEEVLEIAENTSKINGKYIQDIVFGLLDICVTLLFFLPFFAHRTENFVQEVSLLQLLDISLYLKIIFWVILISTVISGVLTLALQNCQARIWTNSKHRLSLGLSILCVILFTICLQPYAAIISFTFLIIKAIISLKIQ